jgi:hypothetical protein
MDTDKQAIAEIINLYQIALDTRSWDLFEDIFTADVVADYCHVLYWTDLAAFVRDFRPMHEETAGHQHSLGVPHIIVEGDRAWALTYGRFNVFKNSPAADAFDMSHGGATYDDELIRTPRGWRISKRVARNFWWQGSLPEDGPYKRIVDHYPTMARNEEIGFLNAYRRVTGRPLPVSQAAE